MILGGWQWFWEASIDFGGLAVVLGGWQWFCGAGSGLGGWQWLCEAGSGSGGLAVLRMALTYDAELCAGEDDAVPVLRHALVHPRVRQTHVGNGQRALLQLHPALGTAKQTPKSTRTPAKPPQNVHPEVVLLCAVARWTKGSRGNGRNLHAASYLSASQIYVRLETKW